MEMAEKYETAFKEMDSVIAQRIKEGKYAALGYTSNLDYLCDFSAEKLSWLLEKYTPDGALSEMKAYAQIHNIKELLHTMVYYCLNGIGGEAGIQDIKPVAAGFDRTLGIGGTGTQAAMALSAVGCPSVVHLTDVSKEVCEILNQPNIYVVSGKGELIRTAQAEHAAEQEVHCIIQFKKGERIRLGQQEAEIPVSNRLILANMTVNVEMPFQETYFAYIEQHAESFASNVLSGFNEVQNLELLAERLDRIERHLQRYKQGNPKGIIFFEDAHYHNCETRRLCIETLYPIVDIVSLNEDELKYTFEMYCCDKDVEDIISCIEGMKYIRHKFGIRKGIIVHTKDYAMYVGDRRDIDIEKGLMYGNMLATAKAMNGWYGTRAQVGETLKLSPGCTGINKRSIVSENKHKDDVVVVPSQYIDKPKYTIGLGDSFAAGVQLCF